MAKKKKLLGIDIGHDRLKMALVDDGIVLDAVAVKMPENLFRDGHITSADTMAGLISSTLKDNNIKANKAAVVLPNESVYIKNVRMPMMTVDQLVYNLPFEFNDYITGEVKDYVFDYAVLQDEEEEKEKAAEMPAEGSAEAVGEAPEAAEAAEEEKTLSLMAVGAEQALIDEYAEVVHKAGLNMVKAAPALCSYITLIREQMEVLSQYTTEFCILDLGYEATRMYIFDGDRHEATRIIEVGMSSIERVIADVFGVENHLAHTYMVSNFDNCLEKEEVRDACDNIAVELMRAMNFYRFSNPDSNLSDMWLCGGGAVMHSLCEAIGGMLDMRLHTASELVPEGDDIPECNSFVQAIGVAFEL